MQTTQSKKRIKGKCFTTIAFGIAMLTACSKHNEVSDNSIDQDQLVECYGVGKAGANTPLTMTKEMCDKLPATKQIVINSKDYVQCYGVAASGKNDCATKNNSCGGFVKTSKAADAWVSLPLGICSNLKDAVVGKDTISSSK